MRAFAYVAFTEDGAKRSGSIVAETETDAAAQLRDKGLYVSDLQARATPKPRLLQARAASLNADLQAVFTRQMAVLLGAGMTVDSALEAVRQGGHRAPGRQRFPAPHVPLGVPLRVHLPPSSRPQVARPSAA